MESLKQNKKCDHKRGLPMYGRSERSWISTQKILGKMVYVCPDCGAFFKRDIEVVEQVSKKEDVAISKEIDKLDRLSDNRNKTREVDNGTA